MAVDCASRNVCHCSERTRERPEESLCVGPGLWCLLSFSLHVKDTEPDPSPPRQALYFDSNS